MKEGERSARKAWSSLLLSPRSTSFPEMEERRDALEGRKKKEKGVKDSRPPAASRTLCTLIRPHIKE